MKRYTVKAAAGMFLLIGFLLFGVMPEIGWGMDDGQGRRAPMSPPPEAFEVCKDKNEGAEVNIACIRGETIKAVCKQTKDGLIAVPKGGFREPGMMPPMGPRSMGAAEKMVGLEPPPAWRHLSLPGLDEKQKEAIKKIKSREAKDNIKKMADVRIADIELRDILDKDPVDMNAVEAKLKKISSLMTDIRLSEIKAVEEIKTKLTPEQRKSFKEMLEMGYRMGGIMRESMKMPPPPHMNP